MELSLKKYGRVFNSWVENGVYTYIYIYTHRRKQNHPLKIRVGKIRGGGDYASKYGIYIYMCVCVCVCVCVRVGGGAFENSKFWQIGYTRKTISA